jgi:hypothetical protein
VVTTKSGVAGDMQVSYNYSVGVASLARQHDLVGAGDYIYYGRMGLAATSEQFPQYMSQASLPTGFGVGNDRTQNTFFSHSICAFRQANLHRMDGKPCPIRWIHREPSCFRKPTGRMSFQSGQYTQSLYFGFRR